MEIKYTFISKKSSLTIVSVAIVAALFLSLTSCKTHSDCKGRKKTSKTAMGGWI